MPFGDLPPIQSPSKKKSVKKLKQTTDKKEKKLSIEITDLKQTVLKHMLESYIKQYYTKSTMRCDVAQSIYKEIFGDIFQYTPKKKNE